MACGDTAIQIGSSPMSAYTYAWSPVDSLSDPLIANPYAHPNMSTVFTVTVTDAVSGCTSTDDILITVTGGPVAYAGSDTTICLGDSVLLVATGGPTYLWSTSETTDSIIVKPIVDTYYVVIVTDATTGCASSDTVMVYVSNPQVDLGPDSTVCKEAIVILDAGPGYTYYWSTGETTQTISVDSSMLAVGDSLISITVLITDSIGCTDSDTIDIIFIDCSGINEIADAMGIKLYPNPSRGKFNVEIKGFYKNNLNMCIYNMTGQLMYCEKLVNIDSKKFTKEIDLGTYPKGIYFIRLMNNEIVLIEKVIIQQEQYYKTIIQLRQPSKNSMAVFLLID